MLSMRWVFLIIHGPLTRYIKLRVTHVPGMPGTFSQLRLQRKPLVSDSDMQHGTCVTHVPWCMSGSFTHGGGETFLAHAQPAILRIWQQTHCHLNEPGQNVLYFRSNIFKCIFLNEKSCILTPMSLHLFPMGLIDNTPALVLVMAWQRTGNKP